MISVRYEMRFDLHLIRSVYYFIFDSPPPPRHFSFFGIPPPFFLLPFFALILTVPSCYPAPLLSVSSCSLRPIIRVLLCVLLSCSSTCYSPSSWCVPFLLVCKNRVVMYRCWCNSFVIVVVSSRRIVGVLSYHLVIFSLGSIISVLIVNCSQMVIGVSLSDMTMNFLKKTTGSSTPPLSVVSVTQRSRLVPVGYCCYLVPSMFIGYQTNGYCYSLLGITLFSGGYNNKWVIIRCQIFVSPTFLQRGFLFQSFIKKLWLNVSLRFRMRALVSWVLWCLPNWYPNSHCSEFFLFVAMWVTIRNFPVTIGVSSLRGVCCRREGPTGRPFFSVSVLFVCGVTIRIVVSSYRHRLLTGCK